MSLNHAAIAGIAASAGAVALVALAGFAWYVAAARRKIDLEYDHNVLEKAHVQRHPTGLGTRPPTKLPQRPDKARRRPPSPAYVYYDGHGHSHLHDQNHHSHVFSSQYGHQSFGHETYPGHGSYGHHSNPVPTNSVHTFGYQGYPGHDTYPGDYQGHHHQHQHHQNFQEQRHLERQHQIRDYRQDQRQDHQSDKNHHHKSRGPARDRTHRQGRADLEKLNLKGLDRTVPASRRSHRPSGLASGPSRSKTLAADRPLKTLSNVENVNEAGPYNGTDLEAFERSMHTILRHQGHTKDEDEHKKHRSLGAHTSLDRRPSWSQKMLGRVSRSLSSRTRKQVRMSPHSKPLPSPPSPPRRTRKLVSPARSPTQHRARLSVHSKHARVSSPEPEDDFDDLEDETQPSRQLQDHSGRNLTMHVPATPPDEEEYDSDGRRRPKEPPKSPLRQLDALRRSMAAGSPQNSGVYSFHEYNLESFHSGDGGAATPARSLNLAAADSPLMSLRGASDGELLSEQDPDKRSEGLYNNQFQSDRHNNRQDDRHFERAREDPTTKGSDLVANAPLVRPESGLSSPPLMRMSRRSASQDDLKRESGWRPVSRDFNESAEESDSGAQSARNSILPTTVVESIVHQSVSAHELERRQAEQLEQPRPEFSPLTPIMPTSPLIIPFKTPPESPQSMFYTPSLSTHRRNLTGGSADLRTSVSQVIPRQMSPLISRPEPAPPPPPPISAHTSPFASPDEDLDVSPIASIDFGAPLAGHRNVVAFSPALSDGEDHTGLGINASQAQLDESRSQPQLDESSPRPQLDDSPSSGEIALEDHRPAAPERVSWQPIHSAVYSHTPQQSDEVELHVGEGVVVLEMYDDGWCLVRLLNMWLPLQDNGRDRSRRSRLVEGVCPYVCLRQVDESYFEHEHELRDRFLTTTVHDSQLAQPQYVQPDFSRTPESQVGVSEVF